MVTFTINQLIAISFLLSAFTILYVTTILYLFEKSIKKNQEYYKDLIGKSNTIFFEKLNKIESDIKDFESNTKKSIDKRFGLVHRTLEDNQKYIEGLYNQNRDNSFEISKIREKMKVTIGKNKSLEDKIESIINQEFFNIQNKEDSNNLENKKDDNDSEKVLILENKLNSITDKLYNLTDELKSTKEFIDLVESKYNKNNEMNKYIENQIKTLYGRFNSIDKKTKPFENYVKNEQIDKIIFEIDNLKSNFQRLSDEITLEEKISEITMDSNSIQTKILNTEVTEQKNIKQSNNIQSLDNIYELFNNSQKEYYINKIKELINSEKILIDECKEIEKNFKEKYPSSHFNFPDGFCSLKINQFGEVTPSSDTLHLLTYNYNNSNKLIEIVFCKHFIEHIDLDKNFHYYVNNQQVELIEITKFNIRPDIPLIISNDSDFVELENYCLKGIYYIMQRRKIILERFNNINKQIFYNY